MSLLSQCGTFATPASTGNQTISLDSGIWGGASPKVVILWSSMMTADGQATTNVFGLGFCTAAAQVAVAMYGQDAQGTSNTNRRCTNDACATFAGGAGTVTMEAAYSSFGANQFVINWTTNTLGANYKVNFLALGGDDLASALIKEIASPTSTGSVAYTGVGFQPTALLAITAISTAADATNDVAALGLGMWTDGAHASIGNWSHDNQDTTDAERLHLVDHLLAVPLVGANYLSCIVTATGADGFTLNWDTVRPEARYCWVLCLSGPTVAVVSDTEATTDTTRNTALGITAKCGLLVSSMATASASVAGDARIDVGALDSDSPINTINSGFVDQDAQGTSVADRHQDSDATLTLYDHANAVVGVGVGSWSTTNLALAWTSTDGTARRWSGLFIGDAPAAETVTVTTPVAYQTYQRDGSDEADIDIEGTYTGTPTAIEASFNGGAYATIDASPSGNAFSGTLSAQAAGQGTLTVRFTNDTGVTDTVANVGIGDVFVVAGQSNALGQGSNARSYSHASLKATKFMQNDAWAECTDHTDSSPGTAAGSCYPLLATRIMAKTGYPVAFITTATNGTGLVNPSTWTKNGTEYADCVQTITNSGVNGVKAVLWYQGEADATNAVTKAAYKTALSTFLNDLQTDTGFSLMKLVCATLGHRLLAGQNADDYNAIRMAHVELWSGGDADVLFGPTTYDVNLSTPVEDHFASDTQLQTLADRWYRCIGYHFYGETHGRGPTISSAAYSGSIVVVTLTGGVSPLVNGDDATGWSVADNGGARTINGASQNGYVITLLVDQPLVGPVTVSFAHFNDAVGSTLKDSGTYPLPPEPKLALSATLTAATGGGTYMPGLLF